MAQLVESSSHKPKGCGMGVFDSQSGDMPRLRVRFLSWGTYKGQPIYVSLSHWCFFPSLSPSLSVFLPLSLKSISMSSSKDFLKINLIKKMVKMVNFVLYTFYLYTL